MKRLKRNTKTIPRITRVSKAIAHNKEDIAQPHGGNLRIVQPRPGTLAKPHPTGHQRQVENRKQNTIGPVKCAE